MRTLLEDELAASEGSVTDLTIATSRALDVFLVQSMRLQLGARRATAAQPPAGESVAS